MPQYQAVFELAELDGANGFALDGESPNDMCGRPVSCEGDFNGDGFADLIIGAQSADPNGTSSGKAYVVFGSAAGFDPVISLGSLDGNNGFSLLGKADYDNSGCSVAAAGDINGDGIDDFIIGAYRAEPNGVGSGAAYVVFGSVSTPGAVANLSDLDGENGFKLNGAVDHGNLGSAVSSAGDVNGDGYADLIVSAPRTGSDATAAGAAYVVFGKDAFDAEIDVSDLDGANGFRIDGQWASEAAGYSISAAGDFNGDGLDDLILGSNWTVSGAFGTAYVVFGRDSSFPAALDVSTLDGANGFQLVGNSSLDLLGWSVADAGDINGDGLSDLIVGAIGATPHGTFSGAAYVMFGTASSPGASLSVTDLNGANGFKLNGERKYDFCGNAVSSAGDFNGDGFADILIAAKYVGDSGYAAGAGYIVFGKAGGFRSELELSSLDGDNGFQINAAGPGGKMGFASGGGDVNGDGFSDVILGAPYGSSTGDETGAAYVVFGGMPSEAVAREGTLIANTIHGSDFSDALSGLAGNDRLFGHDGDDDMRGGDDKDALQGGIGNDTLKGDEGNDLLDGGADNDKLDAGGGADRLNGGEGQDNLNGGKGADRFVYGAAAESTGIACDHVTKADFASDVWDVPIAVTGIDAEIDTGTLRKATFDADLAAAVNAITLGVHHAVVFVPDAGKFEGRVFLIVDTNGAAGYQAGQDLVVQLLKTINLENIGTSDFI